MIAGILTTPRPVPGRLVPAAAGTFLILLALPVFVVTGWPLAGWGLAAVLWVAGETFAFALRRLPLGLDHLASSGLVGVAMTARVVAVMVVLIAVTVSDKSVGVSAALVYIAAYTIELAVSLLAYFGGRR